MKMSDLFSIKSNVTEATDPALIVDPDKEMDRKEIYSLLNRYKETLGPKLAEILDLWADGKTYREIGEKVNLSQARVAQLITKAFRMLRARMNMAVRDDVGHLYGYKKHYYKSTRRGSDVSPGRLYKDMQGNPNLKIVQVGGGKFTIVPKDDLRPEVMYDPEHPSKIARMESDLAAMEDAVTRLHSAAWRADGGAWQQGGRVQQPTSYDNRRRLQAEPVYQRTLQNIEDLKQRIHQLKKKGNWSVGQTNESSKPWDNPNPKKKHSKLSPEKKAAAKARAKRAGRPYPNLIDNMWASKK